MKSVSHISPTVVKIFLAVIFVAALVTFGITSTIKVHSESDVKYRQESAFDGQKERVPEIDAPEGTVVKTLVFSMSYETIEITPTPTPVIDAGSNDIWYKIADCESHKNWKSDTGNGYYGGLQFSQGAWTSVGGQGKPSDSSADEQISRGKLLQQRRGWGAWGACAKKLGLQ